MIPIEYPRERPLSALRGTAHDMSVPLPNPNPRADWRVGEIGWTYVPNRKMLLAGPIILARTENVHPHAMISDVRPEEGRPSEFFTFMEEIFPSQEAILDALFGPAPVEMDAPSCIVKPLFANPLDDDPECQDPGDMFDSTSKLAAAHPGCRVLSGFCAVDPDTGLIPDGCSDWHLTPGDAEREYRRVTGRRHGPVSASLALMPGDEVWADSQVFGRLRYVVDFVHLCQNESRPVRYHAYAMRRCGDDPEECLDEMDFFPSDIGATVFLEDDPPAPVRNNAPGSTPKPFRLSIGFDGSGLRIDRHDGTGVTLVEVGENVEALRDAVCGSLDAVLLMNEKEDT